MITLALQIFLLLLSAFLVGCLLGCLLRRMYHSSRATSAAEAAAATAAAATATVAAAPRPTTPESQRFERALTGGDAPVLATQRREPVVEVRQRAPEPAAPPAPAPAAAPPTSAPARPEPVKAAPASIEIVKAEPQRPAAPPPAAPAPAAAPPPPPAPPQAQPAPPVAPAAPPPPSDADLTSDALKRMPPIAAPVAEKPAAPVTPPAPAAPAKPAAAAYVQSADPAPTPLEPRGYKLDLPPEPAAKPAAPPAAAPVGAPAAAPSATNAGSYAAIAAASAAAAAVGTAVQNATAAPAASAGAASPAGGTDDLKRIRGIDSGLEARLNASGVRRFADIAAWKSNDVTRMNQSLGLVGRIEQENWIEQAQILARGGDTDYSRRQRVASVSSSAAASAIGAAAASAAASHSAQASAGPDRLTRIIGIDSETEKALIAMGFTRYIDISRWTSADIERVERELNRPGRVGLDNWVEQARVLARYAGETETAPRPVKLADAIRENREAAKSAAPAPASRPDLAGLRSVKSEALRGDAGGSGERIDDLKRIRGIGVLIEKRLNSLGVTAYEQVANWTGADIDRISQMLDFKGRIERENWIEQARILASGGHTEFSRRVDRGEVDSSRES